MADEKWQKVREIFDAALRRRPEERRRFVNEVCGDDKILLAELFKTIKPDNPNYRKMREELTKKQ